MLSSFSMQINEVMFDIMSLHYISVHVAYRRRGFLRTMHYAFAQKRERGGGKESKTLPGEEKKRKRKGTLLRKKAPLVLIITWSYL